MDSVSITSAYMWAIVIMLVFFALAVLSACLISFKPNDPGTTKRKIWFWAFCFAGGVVGFLINYYFGNQIEINSVQSKFYLHSCIAAGCCIVAYIILGFVVSKIFPNSKVGTWF